MARKNIFKYIIFLGIGTLFALSNCEECENCGPSTNEPFVTFRFFNIDSLLKVDDTLSDLQIEIDSLNSEIENGNEDLIPARDSLVDSYDYYLIVSSDIKSGKLKVDEVYGLNGQGPIYFADSAKNDSLTHFQFPLDMNKNQSSFVVYIADNIDTIAIDYLRRNDVEEFEVLVEVYDLNIFGHSYDSAKLVCNLDSCNSNESQIYAYF